MPGIVPNAAPVLWPSMIHHGRHHGRHHGYRGLSVRSELVRKATGSRTSSRTPAFHPRREWPLVRAAGRVQSGSAPSTPTRRWAPTLRLGFHTTNTTASSAETRVPITLGRALTFVVIPVGLGIIATVALTAGWGWWPPLFREDAQLTRPRWRWLVTAFMGGTILVTLIASPWHEFSTGLVGSDRAGRSQLS